MDQISMWWNEMLEKEIKEGQGTISNEHLMELEYLGDEINPRKEKIKWIDLVYGGMKCLKKK